MTTKQSDLRTFSQSILAQLKKHGATDAEVYTQSGVAREVAIKDGELEKAESAAGKNVAVRAFVGQSSAAMNFSFAPDQDLSNDLEDLVLAAKMSPEDPFSGIADPDQLQHADAIDFDQYDPAELMNIDALQERARAMEAAASGKEVVVDQAECAHSQFEAYYAASNGFETAKRYSNVGQSVVAIHQGAELTRDYAYASKIYLSDLEDPEVTGQRAFERTWQARNPKRGPSGRFPVMFDERVASSLLGHLISSMSGAAIARRSSWLIDYDEAIFPSSWVIMETPHRQRKLSSSVHDAEGFLRSQKPIVQNGRPEFWITNLASARQLDVTPSGHAMRSGINTSASVASYTLQAKAEKRGDLLKEMGEGLLVTGFIGATINPHTGDYSRGANGFWVRNGEVAEAVNEVTIAANLKDMLPALRAADDADEDKNQIVPSLLIEEMTIAGA